MSRNTEDECDKLEKIYGILEELLEHLRSSKPSRLKCRDCGVYANPGEEKESHWYWEMRCRPCAHKAETMRHTENIYDPKENG